MDYNKAFTGEKYREIAIKFKVKDAETLPLEEVRERAVAAVKQLSIDVGIPQNLTELGVKKEDIPEIAKDALNDVTTPGNPRETNRDEIIELYQKIL